MKKSYFLLSAVLTLCITACNNNNNSKEGGESLPPAPSSMTPEVEPTMDIEFEKQEAGIEQLEHYISEEDKIMLRKIENAIKEVM